MNFTKAMLYAFVSVAALSAETITLQNKGNTKVVYDTYMEETINSPYHDKLMLEGEVGT